MYDILDTHLIKNNEWGAVAYFTQSKYGLCKGDTCNELEANDSNYITGGGDYSSNINQSTSYNIYGIYDMNGGSDEFTLGNYNNVVNSLDGFSALPNSMYLNVYTTENDYLIKDLQHAMFETENLFNDSLNYFVTQDNPWIVRSKLFSYSNSTGETNELIGSRTVLSIK